MTITMYGIKNCDTIKKARAWLETRNHAYAFHDYKVDGIDEKHLQTWLEAVGWERLLNKVGTTFRKLPDDKRQNIDEARALRLMLERPAMIKRPVLDVDGKITVGFKPEIYARVLPQDL